MNAADDYDFKRARILLGDLKKSIRGRSPAFQWVTPENPETVIRGIANRKGLMRLGIDLASAAMTAEDSVTVQLDGTVGGEVGDRILEIVFMDVAPEKRVQSKEGNPPIGCLFFAIFVATLFTLMLIGFGTVLGWMGIGF